MDTTTAPPGSFIQPPPVLVVTQQQQPGHHSGGHFGPVIGVLAVIAVLGMLAGLVGRLCSGRTVLGYGPHLDVEAWVENKCSSCLDGHVTVIHHRQPPQHHPHMAMEAHPTAAATGGWRPHNNDVPNNVTLRTQQPPQQPPQEPPQQHLQRNPQPKPKPKPKPNPNPSPRLNPDMEVHLRPLPTRQASVSEMRGGEPEITSADEEQDDRKKPVNGGEMESEMSDSSEDHDELQHRHRNHHRDREGDEDDDELSHHQQH